MQVISLKFMIKHVPWYKSKKFLVLAMGVFIMFIMVLSSLNVFKGEDTSKKITYNNHIFYKQDTQWMTYINDKPILFFNNPYDVQNITIPDFNFKLSKLYIAYNPADIENEGFIINRIASVLNYFNLKSVPACYNETGCPDIPVINCSKDDSLYLEYSNDTKIYIEGKCLILKGTIDSQLKYTDKIFYNLLGI